MDEYNSEWTDDNVCDLLIAVAYFSIPLQILYMLCRYPITIQRKYLLVGCLFTAFICLCGTTHLFHCLNVSSQLVLISKALTAAVSLITAAILFKVIPEALAVPIYTQELEDHLNNKLVELKHANNSAEVANKQKADFMSFLCHELRNPLHNIVSNIDFLLEDKSITPIQYEYLQSINLSSELMSNIINDVLDINALQSGKLIFERRAIDLYQICNSVIVQSKSRAYAKGLNLECNIDKDIPQYVYSDPTRLYQILINLISNSIKFSSHGDVVLNVTIDTNNGIPKQHITGSTRSLICFSVLDSGIGISSEMRSKLFQPYSQAKLAVVRQQAGTGLGLSIVFSIVKILNGTIDVDSTEGVGSCFNVHLALDHASLKDYEITKRQSMSLPNHSHNENTQHILIVDDNQINRKLMIKILDSLGVRADTAIDGQDAVDKIRTSLTTYNAILMDISMPRMNGYQATTEIRKLGYSGVIIALTANVLSGEREQSKKCGMNHFLSKPIRKQELTLVLSQYLPDWSSPKLTTTAARRLISSANNYTYINPQKQHNGGEQVNRDFSNTSTSAIHEKRASSQSSHINNQFQSTDPQHVIISSLDSPTSSSNRRALLRNHSHNTDYRLLDSRSSTGSQYELSPPPSPLQGNLTIDQHHAIDVLNYS